MRGLDLVWESATPPTHIWERSPKKKRVFFGSFPIVEVGEPDMAKSNISLILLQNQENYNKKIAPFSFDKINNVNIPVNINVSISVVDIIKIEEVDHVYILKFRLVLEWYLFMKLMMTNLYTKGMTIESNIST